MARVLAIEVTDILDGVSMTEEQMEPFITAAEELITTAFTDVTASTTLLMEIERWLVAHMVVSTLHRMGAEEKLGEAQIKYTGKWDIGLNSTPYGQMVLMLDTTGTMANLGKRKASIRAIVSFED